MPQVMPLADSRARAEQVFVMRAVGMQSWSKIRDALGFKSVGAAQNAYKSYAARNAPPTAETARNEIIERKRFTIGQAVRSLADAQRDGDHATVARMIDAITRADQELAKLYGLHAAEKVDVTVSTSATAIVDRAEADLLALAAAQPPRAQKIIDAEVIEESA